jgi:ABC-type multidrug transport system fused ATPase/permease subunit
MSRADRRGRSRGWPVLSGLLRAFLRPHAGRVWGVIVLLTVQAAGNLYLPALNANLINNGVVVGDADYIWRAGGVMLGIVLALGIVSVVTARLASRVSMRAGADMRASIYRQVRGFSVGDMQRFGVPSLITRNINDVQQVQLFLQMALTMLVSATLMSVGAVILAIRESPALSLLLGVTVPVIIAVISVLAATVVPLSRLVQVKIDLINRVLREQITGVRVIRAFRRTQFEWDRFQAANADITGIALRANRIFALVMPLLLGIANLSGVAIIWFGGRLVAEGSMPIGNLTAFLIYILQILMYVLTAVTVIVQIPRAIASAERIEQVLGNVPAITDASRPVIPASVTGAVEFSHVTFVYPGSERPVLSDLTFRLRPGQISAIIGGTGSGKTTMLSLIQRFRDATAGTVLVNGLDVREQATERLWAAIGGVPQTAFLFRGTVASNLRFGMPEATDEQLWDALDIAQALDFVTNMPGQLDAAVDQGGTNLSGGQRQRLSIARAIVRRPGLYLFDDCFSALDPGTDARLRRAVRAGMPDATVVIVAQRVSTIMDADQILVLDAGGVAGIGTHQRLVANCAAYRGIVASQLGEEAVA